MFKKLPFNSIGLCTLCAVVASSQVVAANLKTNLYTNKLSTALEDLQSQKDKKSDLSGDFTLRSNQLVEDVGEVVGNQYWGDLNLEYNTGSSSTSIKKVSVSARANDQEAVMFSAPEAYIKYEWSNSSLTMGRSLLEWGYIDAVWGFGKINNRKNFDYFEPGLEGLTGLVYTKEAPGMSFSIFGSLLYVPELNPGQNYDEDKGTIDCNNPWCKPQSSTAPLEDGKEVPVFYSIEYPEVTDVVFRYSAGARVAMDIGPTTLEVFGIRKPENQLSVAAEYYYDIDVGDKGTAFVDVTPQVYYHDVLGANLKFKLTDYITAYGGGLSITPNTYPDGINPRIVYTGLKPKKKKEDYLGTGVFYEGAKIKGGVHYVARVSDYDLENDLLVEYPRWNQAVNINISSVLTRKLSVAFDYKFDMLTEDRLTMFSASYIVARNMLASAGVNMIGTSGDVESFWSNYSNNDSVYGSLKIKF
ncbi:MAG: hypothetical protein KC478_05235 [Bacteriovoracaceae bacterium]|nr:hypothetical protein [Bacteriovoracaceae bacterium]